MKYYFTTEKTENSYVLILGDYAFRFETEMDQNLYANLITNMDEIDTVKYLISKIDVIFTYSKNNVIIYNLLVNPYFETLCKLFEKNEISKIKKKIIKKFIFKQLSTDMNSSFMSMKDVIGSNIYIEKDMYNKSKKILENEEL